MSQSQTPTVIDPALLNSLGKVVPTNPPDRAPYDANPNSKNPVGIVKPLNPPINYEFGMDLHTPSKK